MGKRKSPGTREARTPKVIYATCRIDAKFTMSAKGDVVTGGSHEHIVPVSLVRDYDLDLIPHHGDISPSNVLSMGDEHQTVHPQVPRGIDWLLGLVVRPDRLEVILDDLEENFRKRVQRNGDLVAAQEWYQRQVRWTFFHSMIAWVPRFAGFIYLLRKIWLF